MRATPAPKRVQRDVRGIRLAARSGAGILLERIDRVTHPALAHDARRTLEQRRAAIERLLPEAPTDTAWRELAETQAALERIEDGTYGRCESCGGAIGRQRLLAMPATRFCMSCSPGAAITRR
jgi:RNA polymerase-binding transcription factor DksA